MRPRLIVPDQIHQELKHSVFFAGTAIVAFGHQRLDDGAGCIVLCLGGMGSKVIISSILPGRIAYA